MIIILPAILDLRSNGEALSQITTLKTEATAFWDIVMKKYDRCLRYDKIWIDPIISMLDCSR
jgi:uncharacterized membrane protein YfhO